MGGQLVLTYCIKQELNKTKNYKKQHDNVYEIDFKN